MNQTDSASVLLQLQALPTFERCFFVQCPDSPGLHFVGGQINNKTLSKLIPFTGTGLSASDAISRALGEACEASALHLSESLQARGLGASTTSESAALHSIFELLEQDALARWWFLKQKPSVIEHIDLEIKHLINILRQNNRTRSMQLLEFNNCLALPIIAAVSFDKLGQCIAIGSAARANKLSAIEAAIREMCQMEYAHHLVRYKLKYSSLSQLPTADQNTIRRASLMTQDRLRSCVDETKHLTKSASPIDSATLVTRLADHGIHVKTTKLTSFNGGIKVYQSTSSSLYKLAGTTAQALSQRQSLAPDCPYRIFEQLLP